MNDITKRTNNSRFMSKNSNLSHPYIQAQKKKKCLNNNNNNSNTQGISSSFSPNNHNSSLNVKNTNFNRQSRQNRKRKFVELFEDDEQGQHEYHETCKIINPPSKQHISEQAVMKSIR